ncbi:MAG: hypothetical protein JSR72_18550 [Proteobacteria bacterium]|nr:hypothetical protein [Pseudomonadota bacterium]
MYAACRRPAADQGFRADLLYLADEAHGFGGGPKALEGLCKLDAERVTEQKLRRRIADSGFHTVKRASSDDTHQPVRSL